MTQDLNRKLLVSFLFLLAAVGQTAAQTVDTSRLEGLVLDENNAAVPGAILTIQRGQETLFTTTSGATGRYVFLALQGGIYRLVVTASGFAEASETVELTRDTRLDLKLRITFTERVDVEAKGENLTAILLTGDRLKALPADPRLLLQRLQRLAGASGTPDSLAVYVDGFREDGKLPPKEVISAILINADPFSAQFPEPGKSRVEIITKPATERVRGEINYYFSDEGFNARNAFASTRAPFQIRNYSGAVSIPLIPAKWGLFGEFSRNETDDNAVINAQVLNAATLLPEPYRSTVIAPIAGTNASIRSSRLLRTGHTFDVRYLFSKEAAVNQGLQGGFDLPERSYRRSWLGNTIRASLISTFGEKMLNEARVSWGRGHSSISADGTGYAVIVPGGLNAGGNQDTLFLEDTTWNFGLENNVTRVSGRHILKAGGSFAAVSIENTDRSNFGGTFTFGTDFERGPTGFPLPNGSYIWALDSYRYSVQRRPGYRPEQFVINQGDPFIRLKQANVGLFAQDDLKISDRLTLTFGLRGEYQTNLNGKVDAAPRIGVAFRPFRDIPGVLRIGAGVFYSRVDPGITIDELRFDGVRQEELVIIRPPFFPVVPPEFNRATVQSTLRPKSPDLRSPAVYITKASYEQPWRGLTAGVSYTYERGNHLLRTLNINAPLPNTDRERPNPDFGPILEAQSSGSSRRHELALSLHGDLHNRLSFYGSYSLASAKSDTDGHKTTPADSYFAVNEFGYSKLDRRHQFYLEAYAQLPWKLSITPSMYISSGLPFNIVTGSDNNGDTQFNDRPAFGNFGDEGVIVTPLGLFTLQPTAGNSMIPRNFGRGRGYASVNLNVSRTFGFGLEATQADACSSGTLRCGMSGRRYALTFSADVQNLLNRTNFSEFDNVVTSPLFGRPNRAHNARHINLGITLSF